MKRKRQAGDLLLSLVTLSALGIAALVALVGLFLAFRPGGETEIRFFGQSVRTGNAGIACLFMAAVMIVIVSSMYVRMRGRDGPARRRSRGTSSPSDSGSLGPRPKVFRVFVSGPNDMKEEKDLLERVVREVGEVFQEHDLLVLCSRGDRNVIPGLGDDPQQVVNDQLPTSCDLYVGVMGQRLGTPTPRESSGTVEEFEQARDRFLATGRPHVLFYFSTAGAAGHKANQAEQTDAVLRFQADYPGLYSLFADVSDLASTFRYHLTRLLVRELLGVRTGLFVRRCSSWSKQLACWTTKPVGTGPNLYLDHSTVWINYSLSQLSELVDLDRVLTPFEQDALVIAQYLRAGVHCGLDMTDLARRLAGVAGLDRDLGDAAVMVASQIGQKTDLASGDWQIGGARCDLLIALLRVADLVSLDRTIIRREPSAIHLPVPADGALEEWLAYYTRQIRVRREGIASYQLVALSIGGAFPELLRECIDLRFEELWQALRPLLTRHGICLVRGQSGIAPIPDVVEPPPAVGRQMEEACDHATKVVELLRHLGDEELVEGLRLPRPHPNTVIRGPLRIPVNPHYDRCLVVRLGEPTGQTAQPVRTLACTGRNEILIEPGGLQAGVRYWWELQRDDGFGDIRQAGIGAFQILPENDAKAWNLVLSTLDTDGRRSVLANLGLWDDLVYDLGQDLATPNSSTTTLVLGYYTALTACEWLKAHRKESLPQGNSWWDAGGRIAGRLFRHKENQT